MAEETPQKIEAGSKLTNTSKSGPYFANSADGEIALQQRRTGLQRLAAHILSTVL